jgi:transposase-like protein
MHTTKRYYSPRQSLERRQRMATEVGAGKSVREVAADYGVNVVVVYAACRKYGVKLRRKIPVGHLPRLPGVYRIVNTVTKECYIGGTHNIRVRVAQQLGRLERGDSQCQRMQESYNEFGKDAFRSEVLELCDLLDVPLRETFYLRTFPRATFNVGRWSTGVKGSRNLKWLPQ